MKMCLANFPVLAFFFFGNMESSAGINVNRC